ncbi:MAG: protein translocase subunit SecD [Oscillospiraceae bacterium]|nr:protein translocase subunit SecD [Oscillospiraceae bacterium]
MGKSIVKFAAIALIIFLICWIAINGLEIGRDFYMPGVTSDRGIVPGLDLVGGSVIVFEADVENPMAVEMGPAISLLRQRLDENMGLHEATIEHLETSNRLRVEIPGIENPQEAAEQLGAMGLLTFVSGDGRLIMTGAEVVNAIVSNEPVREHGPRERHIVFELTEAGRLAFAEATERIAPMAGQGANEDFPELFAAMTEQSDVFPTRVEIRNPEQPVWFNSIAIILDDYIVSAPSVNARLDTATLTITSGGQGGFSEAEARRLTDTINLGRLDFGLTAVQHTYVSATLGEQALPTSVRAGLIGLLLIFLFMLIVYRIQGVVSGIALLTFMGIFGIILAVGRMNLTLPGIAGILLTIGMANDAEILIFERIKEEMRLGKTVRAAVDSGFRRALPAIIDGEVTTFIIAFILFWQGTGPVAGFGQKLMLGVAISFFTAVILTRILLKVMVGLNIKHPRLYGVGKLPKGGDA